jgi:gliding motility-associated-like protein
LVYGLTFDRGGFPYVMGTSTGSWPVVNATFSNPGSKQFISKLRPDLSGYEYSTVFGVASPQPNISPIAFMVDRCENVYVSGWGGGINNNQGYSTGNTRGMAAINPLGPAFATNDGQDFYFFVMERDAQSQLFGTSFGQNGGLGDHVDGGTSRFDENGIIYQAMCANCGKNVIFPTTPGVWSTVNGSNNCNEAAVKIEMNFSGVSSNVNSTINTIKGLNKACVPFTVLFTDSLKKGKKYYWDFGNGIRDTTLTGSDTFRYTQPGTYQITLIVEDSSTCNIRDTSRILIYASNNKAILDFSYRKLPPCQNTTMEFTNLTTALPGSSFGPASFTWDFGDNTPPVTAGLNTVTHTYAGPGTYIVTLRLLDTTFCNSPDLITRTIRISSLVDASFTTPSIGCKPYSAVFENTSSAGTAFIWDFGDGTTASDISVFVNHTYNDTGTYRVRLIAIDTGTCNRIDTSDYFTVRVVPGPDALFTWAPNPPQPNIPVQFTNLSLGAVRYLWFFGDGDSSTLKDPEHLYNASGNYRASLIVYNDAGCPDTFSLSVQVVIDPLLDVPTAFTPGRFGTNGLITVRGFGIAKMIWRIYNRWGQLVFESTSVKSGWDGTFKGKLQPMDVYTYTLDAELSNGTKVRKTGDITLLR